MAGTDRGPFGVWFSLALVILVLSAWAGSLLGAAAAHFWYSRHQLETGTLSHAELMSLESELNTLNAIQILRLIAEASGGNGIVDEKYLVNEIRRLGTLKHENDNQEMKSLLDMNIGFVYLELAAAEQKSNRDALAKKNMQAAQMLFKSLGWRDYSEETLKALAARRVEWTTYPGPKAEQK